MATTLDEIHPGEILLEEFMKPMGITVRQLAAVTPTWVISFRYQYRVNGRQEV